MLFCVRMLHGVSLVVIRRLIVSGQLSESLHSISHQDITNISDEILRGTQVPVF